MLKDAKTFSSYSVNDIRRALSFYTEILGLEVEQIPEGLDLKLPNNHVFIYPKQDHKPATYTVLNFMVDDIDAAVDELVGKGVTFEQYDTEFMKTDAKGISRQGDRSMAWFKDPANNFLSLMQRG